MLDRRLLNALSPALRRVALGLARRGIGADTVTWFGFGAGMASAVSIALGHPLIGLALMGVGRLADGLDGALARQTRSTDRGAFLDIALDFVFYASVPLAFALADPARNALPAAALLTAFMATASSFLAFSVMAERRGLASTAHPGKGLVYLGGLTEGAETLACFAAMCLWPHWFGPLAYGFAALCGLTWLTRLYAGWTQLRDAPAADVASPL